jgi:hypothetical protein
MFTCFRSFASSGNLRFQCVSLNWHCRRYTYIDTAECTIYVNLFLKCGNYTDLKIFIFQPSVLLSHCPFMGPNMLPYTYTLFTILYVNRNS